MIRTKQINKKLEGNKNADTNSSWIIEDLRGRTQVVGFYSERPRVS